MIVYGLDPGPERSALVAWDGEIVLKHSIMANSELLDYLSIANEFTCENLGIEWISSYGQKVGSETFDTCLWVGRFMQEWFWNTELIRRRDISLHLCENTSAGDKFIRQAIIDRIGKPGTKKAPGPTYGIAGDEWAALACAVTYHDMLTRKMARAQGE